MAEDPREILKRNRALLQARKDSEEGEQLLEKLPQGHGSGLNADMVDGMHAAEIIAKAPGKGGGGTGSGGMEQHGNEYHTPDFSEQGHAHTESEITDLDHDAQKIKGKEVDDSGIGDNKVLTYKTASGKIEYAAPAGSGDMTKAVYDTDEDGIVDNAEKLEGSTKTQVQDHAPKAHTHPCSELTDHTKVLHDGLNIDADTLDLMHADEFATDAELTTHAANENAHHDKQHSIEGPEHTGTIDDDQFEGTGEQKANTTPSSFTTWASQSGNARKVLVFDEASGKPKWEYVTAIDVLTPAQILTFQARPSGSYPDGTWGVAMVASSGEDTPYFQMTYQGTPTAASIDISPSEPDYPDAVASPYTSHTGDPITRGTSVGAVKTFTLTATVDGQEKQKTATITYVNERMWGVSSEAAIDTQGEIDTFRTAQNKELSNARAKTFSVTAGAGEYIYYILRSALGTPTFKVGGFEGGFQQVGTVSWQNPRGFAENYQVWRSTNAGLGATTVEVT